MKALEIIFRICAIALAAIAIVLVAIQIELRTATTSPLATPREEAESTQRWSIRTDSRTIALKPTQESSFSELPKEFDLRVRSQFPVNISVGNCRASLTTDADLHCVPDGDSLTITDSRSPALFANPYNSVSLTFRYKTYTESR